jgi:uncharacterized membrane protein (UPF0127 family)
MFKKRIRLRLRDDSSIRIRCERTQAWVAEDCRVASGLRTRLVGLIGTTEFLPGSGLLLLPCAQIHMWFMQIPLDILFLQRVLTEESGAPPRWKICSTHEQVPPWNGLPLGDRSAQDTLELPVGTIRRCDLKSGDLLCIS